MFISSGLAVFIEALINGLIWRNTCEVYGNFSIVKRGHVLRGFVLETLPEQEFVQCKYACVDHPRCKSINREDTDIGTCELNEKSIEDMADANSLVPRAGWMFSSTDYDAMNVSSAVEALCILLSCSSCSYKGKAPGGTRS